jgi:hypothetical protein
MCRSRCEKRNYADLGTPSIILALVSLSRGNSVLVEESPSLPARRRVLAAGVLARP